MIRIDHNKKAYILKMPPFDLIQSEHFPVNSHTYSEIENRGDGNCFYEAVLDSAQMYLSSTHYLRNKYSSITGQKRPLKDAKQLRQALVQWLDSKNEIMKVPPSRTLVSTNKEWATDDVIQALSYAFDLCIIIHSESDKRWTITTPYFDVSKNKCVNNVIYIRCKGNPTDVSSGYGNHWHYVALKKISTTKAKASKSSKNPSLKKPVAKKSPKKKTTKPKAKAFARGDVLNYLDRHGASVPCVITHVDIDAAELAAGELPSYRVRFEDGQERETVHSRLRKPSTKPKAKTSKSPKKPTLKKQVTKTLPKPSKSPKKPTQNKQVTKTSPQKKAAKPKAKVSKSPKKPALKKQVAKTTPKPSKSPKKPTLKKPVAKTSPKKKAAKPKAKPIKKPTLKKPVNKTTIEKNLPCRNTHVFHRKVDNLYVCTPRKRYSKKSKLMKQVSKTSPNKQKAKASKSSKDPTLKKQLTKRSPNDKATKASKSPDKSTPNNKKYKLEKTIYSCVCKSS